MIMALTAGTAFSIGIGGNAGSAGGTIAGATTAGAAGSAWRSSGVSDRTGLRSLRMGDRVRRRRRDDERDDDDRDDEEDEEAGDVDDELDDTGRRRRRRLRDSLDDELDVLDGES